MCLGLSALLCGDYLLTSNATPCRLLPGHREMDITDGQQWSNDACMAAASLGMLQELDRLQDLQPLMLWCKETWTAAAAHGEVDVLHWVQSHDAVSMINVTACLRAAAENGHAHVCRSVIC